MSSIDDLIKSGNLSSTLNSSGAIASDSNSSLDKDAFLNLLVTQLQYQDPTNPVEDKEFLAQMAQFTTLEQMQNMNATLTQSTSYALVGKYGVLENYNSETGNTDVIEGRIEGVSIKSGEAYVTISDTEYLASSITNVYEDYTEMGFMQNIKDALLTSENVNLVGKTVQAIITDSDGNPIEFVEGKVDYVKFENGSAILSVNNKDVYAGEVLTIADNNLIMGKEINYKTYDSSSDTYDYYSGTISDVKFVDGNPYAQIKLEDGSVASVAVTYINHISEALNYVGNTVKYEDTTYTVDDVVIYDGALYLVSGDKEIKYSDVRGS